MKASLIFLVLCLCFSLLSGCGSAPKPAPSNLEPTRTNHPPPTMVPTLPPPPTRTATGLPLVGSATETPMVMTDRGPTRTPTDAPVPTHQPDWIFTAGAPIWSPIRASAGVIYFGCEDATLYAVDAQTHALKWKFKAGGAVRSRPELSKTLVYAVGDDSLLYAVSVDKGVLAWKTPIGTAVEQRDPAFNPQTQTSDIYTSAPALQDGVVYVGGTDNKLYAIDAETGLVKWKFELASMATMIRFTPVVGNGLVYFEDNNGAFYAVDIKNGVKAWTYQNGSAFGNGATLVGQVVYTSGGNAITALDALTGKIKWSVNSVVDWLVPAYADGVLYAGAGLGTGQFTIGAYAADTGKPLWMAKPLTNFLVDSPVVGNNKVYIGENLTGFFAIDKKTGATAWEIPVPAGADGVGVFSTGAVAGGMVYFGGMDGKLYAVKDE